MGKPRYITTPLYYVNAKPHLGHAYTTLLADSMKRFSQQQGEDCLMLTGTDEHGEKIAQSAEKSGKSPLEFADGIVKFFELAWEKLGIRPDIFYRTTRESHYKLVQKALQRLKNQDDIYFASYTGKYCLGCERFRTDQEWDEKGLCPDHQTPPEIREESNYFFKMSKYQDRLKDFYKENGSAISPQNYLREAVAMLDSPLEDLCISRPTTRLKWGIPLPFDDKYVTYVWFDALLNYVGGLGYTGGKPTKETTEEKGFKSEFWAEAQHLIGKDILKTHAIYWPTMLMALGLPPFKQLLVNGFWLTSGLKMSKSLGNVVDPITVQERFGSDAFRYFLLRDMSYGHDANFTWESFIQRANADLANGIGNLASRTLTLVHKNLDAKVPSRSGRSEVDKTFLSQLEKIPALYKDHFDNARFHLALAAFSEGVANCDRYINDQKPWSLAKDPDQRDRLVAVLGTAMDALALLSVVSNGVLPEGTCKLRTALGFTDAHFDEKAGWSVIPWALATQYLPEGTQLGETPRLYPRLELPTDPE